MAQITRSFTFQKETPGTRRFAEDEVEGEAPVMGTLYVKKFICQQLGNPETLTVSISVPD